MSIVVGAIGILPKSLDKRLEDVEIRGKNRNPIELLR